MNYNFFEINYPSSDGVHTIYAEIYVPKTATAKGIVQLAHGMTDYPARYKALADYLTGEGYIFAGNHHLGHGRSVSNPDDYGFFATKGGVDCILKDLKAMNKYLRDTFPTLPLVLMGHSMGSFIARLYATAYPHTIKGLIIHGTAGPNPLANVGIMLSKLIASSKGERYRSPFITSMAFSSYNDKFPKEEGDKAWLTRDVEKVAGKSSDSMANFTFTLSGYMDLFRLIRDSNSNKWFNELSKTTPTLIMSGDMDPVGNYGKGPRFVYKKLMLKGHTNLSIKMYEGARHELFNEFGREEIFADMVEWLGGVCK